MADRRSISMADLETLLQKEDGLLEPVNTDLGTGIVEPDSSMDADNPIQDRLDRLTALGKGTQRYKDTATWLDHEDEFLGPFGTKPLDVAGEFAWGFEESASFGALGVAAETTKKGSQLRQLGSLGRHKPWDEQHFAGNAGYILGSGIGMLIPLTGWMSGLSFLTRAGRGLTAASKLTRAASISEKLASKYAAKKGAAHMAKQVTNIGDDALNNIIRESDEILGFSSRNPLVSKRFKQITKNNVKALDDATRGMKDSISKFAPGMSEAHKGELAKDLLEVMLKNNPGDIHRILSKFPILRSIPGKGGEVAVAAASNFATGLIYHTGNEAVGNLTFALANATGMDINEEAAKMHPSLYKNKESTLDAIMESMGHGLGFAAIAPAHYFRGGRATAPRKEMWNGLKNMVRSWKPLGRLKDSEAIARVRMMETSAQAHGGMSIRNFVKHDSMNTPGWINTLTGDQAKSILSQTRKQFATEWLPYIGSEITQDLYGSLPRMITGSMLMQLPSLIHSGGEIGDPKEFATHALMGMFFAKKGRVFKEGRKLGWGGEHIWQTGQ